ASPCAMREAMHQGIAIYICAQLHSSTDMRSLADAIQGDLRCRQIVLCPTHHHPRYIVACMVQMPGRYCSLSAVSKLRASSANVKSRTDLLSSLSECRVAAEILSLSFMAPTDDVCAAEVSTAMWV
ncbi:unnamed protein product, partial [Polarella glacialis]